jgi:hypothetical protein
MVKGHDGAKFSPHGSQEVERETEKEIERERECLLPPLSPFIPSGPPAYGVVPPTFRTGLSHLVNLLWKCPDRYTQKCALLIS